MIAVAFSWKMGGDNERCLCASMHVHASRRRAAAATDRRSRQKPFFFSAWNSRCCSHRSCKLHAARRAGRRLAFCVSRQCVDVKNERFAAYERRDSISFRLYTPLKCAFASRQLSAKTISLLALAYLRGTQDFFIVTKKLKFLYFRSHF